MAETVAINNNNKSPLSGEQSYHRLLVEHIVEHTNGGTSHYQAIVKTIKQILPAEGHDKVSAALNIHDESSKSITIPDDGFSLLMACVYLNRSGNTMQAVLSPVHKDHLIFIEANHVETILVSMPFTSDNYASIVLGSRYFVTIDLKQPEPIKESLDTADSLVEE